MSEEEMTRFYITVSSPKEYRLTRYKGVHFEDPNHTVKQTLTTSLDLNLLTNKLAEVKRQQEAKELNQIVNKNKLEDLKLKISSNNFTEPSQQTIRKAISPKSFFLSKRGLLGSGDSSSKLSNTLNNTERYLKHTASTKRSHLYSDQAKSTHRLNKSTVSTLFSEGQLSANKDSSRTIEQILSGRAKEEYGKKPSLIYKNIFSSFVERSNDKSGNRTVVYKKITF